MQPTQYSAITGPPSF